MTALLATLEGDNGQSRVYRSNGRRYQDPRLQGETMGGLFDFVKSATKAAISPIVSVAKGSTHMVAEAGRGIKTGDIGRIIKAPIKGVGHTTGTFVRTQSDHLEYYWRPSKASQWMGPAGMGLSAAAPFTGPAAPFLLAGGAALTVGGAVHSKIHSTHLERQAVRQAGSLEASQSSKKAAELKKRNTLFMGLGAAALIGGVALIAL